MLLRLAQPVVARVEGARRAKRLRQWQGTASWRHVAMSHRVRRAAAYSCERCSTLSLIATFSLQNSTLYFMLLKRPPTRAARWMTCVGLCFSKMALVCSLSRKSPSFDVRKIHVSAAFASRSMLALMPWPTRPEPPVTITTMLVGGGGGGVAIWCESQRCDDLFRFLRECLQTKYLWSPNSQQSAS